MGKNRPKSYEYKKIYEKEYGRIPKGYHIHHIDGNPFNNSIENLSCISPEDHKKIHKNEFVLWANKGGKIGGKKCVENKLGWYSKNDKELHSQRLSALKKANTKENIEKRSNTFKKNFSEGNIIHWSKKENKNEVIEKIKKGDPGKSTRGKAAWNRGIKMKIKDPETARNNKSIAALKRKKYGCSTCGKQLDAGNLKKHEKKCGKS